MAANILEEITIGRLAFLAVLFCVASLALTAFSQPKYPQFQWIGEGRGVIAWLKGNFKYPFSYSDWVKDGYNKVLFRAIRWLVTNACLVLEEWTAVHHSWHSHATGSDRLAAISDFLDAESA